MLINAPYPQPCQERENALIDEQFGILRELIRSVRGLRVDAGLAPDLKLSLALKITAGTPAEICNSYTDLIKLLAGVNSIQFTAEKPRKAIGAGGAGYEVFVLVEGAVNGQQLAARFNKELEQENRQITALETKLGGSFAQKAPAEVVASEREKLALLRAHAEKLVSYIGSM
jgi:valyl-tRNA synthetase